MKIRCNQIAVSLVLLQRCLEHIEQFARKTKG
jgi:hypothetical protein